MGRLRFYDSQLHPTAMSISPPDPKTFSTEKACEPLSSHHWGEEEAAHLLRRMGFSATPHAVKQALRSSPEEIVREAFIPSDPPSKSDSLVEYENTAHERYRHIYSA